MGTVETHLIGHLQQGIAERLGHAVQRLKFVALPGHLEHPGHFNDSAHGPDIVRGHGKVTDVMMTQNLLRTAFKRQIAFLLDRIHRDIPAVLARMHHLIIPVGALDQTNRNVQPGCARPGQETVQISVTVIEVALHGQAQMGVRRKLLITSQALVQFNDHVTQCTHLCINTQEAAQRLDSAIHRLDTLQHVGHGPLEVGRICMGIQGRRLDGHIDLGRRRPVEIGRTVLAQRLPLPLSPTHTLQQIHITLYVGVGFCFAHRGLTQDIQGKGKALLLTQSAEVLYGLFHGAANNKLQGHHLEILSDGLAQQVGAQLACHAG